MSDLDNGFNYVVNSEEKEIIYHLPFNPLKNEEYKKCCIEEDSGFPFSLTIEEQINDQLKVAFGY